MRTSELGMRMKSLKFREHEISRAVRMAKARNVPSEINLASMVSLRFAEARAPRCAEQRPARFARRDAAQTRRRGRLRYEDSTARCLGRLAGEIRKVHFVAGTASIIIYEGSLYAFSGGGSKSRTRAKVIFPCHGPQNFK